MRAVVQRVARARVIVDGKPVGAIGRGLCVLLGVARGDGGGEAQRLAGKVARLRIFEDAEGRFDSSLVQTAGEALVVSQFTLLADTAKGNRPSFTDAAAPEQAEPLYERVADRLDAARGRFGAHMEVELVNDGPVTLLLESPGHPGAQ